MSGQPYSSIIIIGAARSGTNMLRDVLTSVPRVATWDCDEIPFVWRYGNVSYPHDEFTPDMARPNVKIYVRGAFDRLARRTGAAWVVEKTCANSLRVGFVDQVFPSAKFIWIMRDGRDAVASAMKRWVARLELPYLAKKARYVPIGDLPYYGVRFLSNRARKLLSRNNQLAAWGPRFIGMDDLRRTRSLLEVCAAQWARSVDNSCRDFSQIDDSRVHTVTYEDFVHAPEAGLARILDLMEIKAAPESIARAVQKVSGSSVGRGVRGFDADALRVIEPIIGEAMKRQGYPRPTMSV